MSFDWVKNDPIYKVFEGAPRHECPERTQHLGIEASRPTGLPAEKYGPAITEIVHHEGRWWATNGEYSTQISGCPWCCTELDDPHHEKAMEVAERGSRKFKAALRELGQEELREMFDRAADGSETDH
jgi:hypothetical protein